MPVTDFMKIIPKNKLTDIYDSLSHTTFLQDLCAKKSLREPEIPIQFREVKINIVDFSKLETRVNRYLNGEWVNMNQLEALDSQKEPRKWEFTVPHPTAVCEEEIITSVGRFDPLVIVQHDDKPACAFIHDSIIKKATQLGCAPVLVNEAERVVGWDVYKVLLKEKSSIAAMIRIVKEIKKSPWHSRKQQTKVQVFVPKI